MKNSRDTAAPEAYRAHIDGFIKTFLANEHGRRWASLLALKAHAWSRVPIAGFPYQCKKEFCHELVGIRKNLYDDADLSVLGNPDVVLIRAGHDKNPGVDKSSLIHAVSDYELISEGIISVDPGHLALVVDHESRAFLCFDRGGKYRRLNLLA